MPFIHNDVCLNRRTLVEFSLTLSWKLLHKSNIFFQTFYFNILFKHLDESLHDELLEKFSVYSWIFNFFSESFFNFFLNTFDKLMSESHFSHSGLVDFSTFHNFDISFKVFLLFVEIWFIFISRLVEDFISFELLLISRFLLDDRDLLILIFANGLSKLVKSSNKSLFVIQVHCQY